VLAESHCRNRIVGVETRRGNCKHDWRLAASVLAAGGSLTGAASPGHRPRLTAGRPPKETFPADARIARQRGNTRSQRKRALPRPEDWGQTSLADRAATAAGHWTTHPSWQR
jgi:hypothetical protein